MFVIKDMKWEKHLILPPIPVLFVLLIYSPQIFDELVVF